jgi:hypothetical protein
MAVGIQISVEEYLHTVYRPDCDYVEGVVEKRNLGEGIIVGFGVS